jgi:hypothetical protein
VPRDEASSWVAESTTVRPFMPRFYPALDNGWPFVSK